LNLISWLFHDQLKAVAEREIRANADIKSGIVDAERVKQTAALEREILVLEREREAVIEAAAAEGTHIARDPEADYRAICGPADTMPAPRE
jgi:hypothetical protein